MFSYGFIFVTGWPFGIEFFVVWCRMKVRNIYSSSINIWKHKKVFLILSVSLSCFSYQHMYTLLCHEQGKKLLSWNICKICKIGTVIMIIHTYSEEIQLNTRKHLSLKMSSILLNVSQNLRNGMPSGCWSQFRLSYLAVPYQVLYDVNCL